MPRGPVLGRPKPGQVVPRTGPVPAHGPAKKQPIHDLNHASAQVVPGGPDLDHQGMNFMSAAEVVKIRGRTPQELGLIQTRKWVGGSRVRGYWVGSDQEKDS